MSLLLIAPERNLEPFKKALFRQDPDLDIDIWPDVTDRKRVTFAVTWNHPENLLDKFPNLKAVSSFGAGVEHLTEDKSLRDDITITRLVAPALKTQVADYVEMSCYNVMRRSADYFRQEQKKVWKVLSHSMKKDLAIGILGLGEIGANAAERMAGNQWHVSGWSRGPKQVSGVRTFSGPEGKTPFLKETNIAVSLLPLTPETEGILNLDLFKKLKKPAYLINAGRGGHLVEEDLIYALDAGIL
ncbi:MAG: NAD(P)-dependent oxidoreductase, partial [Balneolaceae bacterium]